MAFDISSIPAPVLSAAEDEGLNALEAMLAITPEEAAAYMATSRSQNPDWTIDQYKKDATGKFEHGIRIGKTDAGTEIPKFFGDIIDELWPFIKTYAANMVDAAVAGGA